jgi:hypothetical protein
MSIRITCIKKSGGHHADPHYTISELAWINKETRETGTSTRLVVHDWIKNQNGVPYVRDSSGNQAKAGTREHANGVKFVQTYADRVWTDNLLALPECR